jgi:hypothetical protein
MPKRGLMLSTRLLLALMTVGAVALMGGCSSPQPTATPRPTPTRTPVPTATPTPTPQPLDLVVLHTNDTIGYTEPCG